MLHSSSCERHDINRFPSEKGLIVFPISMSRIANSQSAEACWTYLEALVPKIPAHKQGVGLVFLFGEWLYLYSNEPAVTLRTKYLGQLQDFQNRIHGLLLKNPWYVPSAFSYVTWLEALLTTNDFPVRLGELKQIYRHDEFYQALVRQDITEQKRDPDCQNNVNFILEETLLFYLLTKGKIRLRNSYIQGQEEWVLNCYPGKPLLSEAYLYEKNFFRLSHPKNRYEQAFYDLNEKKLYGFESGVTGAFSDRSKHELHSFILPPKNTCI